MPLFAKTPTYCGLELTHTHLRKAYLKRRRNSYSIEIKEWERVNLLDSPSAPGIAIAALPAREMLVRSCEIEVKKKRDLMAALEFQIEPLIPYPLQQAVIQTEIIKKKSSGTQLALFSVRKDHLRLYLASLEACGLSPQIVTSLPYALATFSRELLEPAPLIIHIGEEVSCLLLEEGKVIACRAFALGGHSLNEIQKTLLSYAAQFKQVAIEKILYLGADPAWKTRIEKITGKKVLLPLSKSLPLTSEELSLWCIPIGCSLAHAGINFRQKEFAYPKPWKSNRGQLLLFFSLSAALYLSLYLFTAARESKIQKQIAEKYQELLKIAQVRETGAPSSPMHYERQLDAIEMQFESNSEAFPLYPQIPKVQDLLAWLSSQPIFASEEISIEGVRYTLVKHPSLAERHEHYQVRVELLLHTKNPQLIPLIHEVLKSSNTMIDKKEEINVLPDKEKYKISFFLKDKTIYHA
jgi:type IV pilus assembly protein PilM